MSYRRNNNKVSVKKSCKFCKDAGKSEEEYTSHFLRETKDPNSRITCPTLLLIECRYCSKKGHTVSKCAKLLNSKNGDKQKNTPSAPRKAAWSDNNRVVPTNHFDILSELGDEDVEEISLTDETVSTCLDCCNTPASVSTSSSTYAEILARPKPVSVGEVGTRLSILSKARMMRSWADYSDSDDE